VTDPQAYAAVLDLLGRVPRAPWAGSLTGAAPEQLSALDETLGYPAPPSVRTWLTLCNGYLAGPGNLYGSTTGTDFLDIASVLDIHPRWRAKQWLPVAGDGTGNEYIVDASRAHLAGDGVFFVDVSEDPLALAYVVGSGLPEFLEFLLERELGDARWPFNADSVLARDPAIAEVTPSSLLPWS
jgi:hypothetical protein